jgi:hypothetical protein
VNDCINAPSDCVVHSGIVTDVGFDELEIAGFQAVVDVAAFDLGIVKVVEVINPDQGTFL